jgi:hypothetical protein
MTLGTDTIDQIAKPEIVPIARGHIATREAGDTIAFLASRDRDRQSRTSEKEAAN